MKFQDRVKFAVENILHSLSSVVKMLLLSKRVKHLKLAESDDDELVILANGPSLNSTIADSLDFVMKRKRWAVNFAANAEVFTQLKPQFYLLADPLFFSGIEKDNIRGLWRRFREDVDWAMTLYIPANVKNSSDLESLSVNPNITIARYNLTPVQGWRWLTNFAYKRGYGMPRPRNVLIPSIMVAMGAGFKTIYIAGADHSWSKTISVDDDNNVVSIQPHFYKDSEQELDRIKTDYMDFPLHQIMFSFYVAFRSYHYIQEYALRSGVAIYNITPDSFIDAFPRYKC